MDLILMEALTLLFVAALIWVFRRRLAASRIFNPETLVRLEQVERDAAQTKQTCSQALDDLRKSLESLEQRTVAAEQKWIGTGAVPAGARKELYHAAALLLYAGHPTERVADVLDMPPAQVEMVRELQKMIAAESLIDAAHEPPARNGASGKTPKGKKSTAHPGQAPISPMLLTDIATPEDLALHAGERTAINAPRPSAEKIKGLTHSIVAPAGLPMRQR